MTPAPIYCYNGWLFVHNRPRGIHWPLDRYMRPKKQVGDRFFDMIEQWQELSNDEKQQYLVDKEYFEGLSNYARLQQLMALIKESKMRVLA